MNHGGYSNDRIKARRTSVRRRGLALMVVLTVVAAATLIGLAMLSMASVQEQAVHSMAKSASAAYLAESAEQAALYYIQNPTKMPAGWATTPGFVIKTSNAALSGVDGSFDLSVTTAKPNNYAIVATGRSGGGLPVVRKINVLAQTLTATPTYAGGFGGAITVPPRHSLESAVANGAITVNGTISGASRESFGPQDFAVPTASTINYYGANIPGGTYTMPDGTVGTPQVITSPLSSPPTIAGTNPAGVLYCSGDLEIRAPLTFSGTLIVRGNLTINTAGSVILTAHSGFPALVADKKLIVTAGSSTTTINGVAWLGSGTSWSGSTFSSYVTINGALLMPGGAAFGSTSSGTVAVNYQPANVQVVNLTTTPQPVLNIKLLNWVQ